MLRWLRGVIGWTSNQRAFFDSRTREVNEYNLARYLGARRRLLGDLPPGCRLLDVGCGEGLFADRLGDEGVHVTGVDVSAASLAWARRRRYSFRMLLATAEELPFADGIFDLVLGNAVLHHVEDVEGSLQEMFRVARSGGRVVVIEPSRINPLIAMQALSKRVEWKVFLLAESRVRGYALANPRVGAIERGGLMDLFYPYRSFPPQRLRSVVGRAEQALRRLGFYTHFVLDCRIIG